MNSNDKIKNYTIRYIIVTYIAFWLGILFFGGIYLLTNNDLCMNFAIVLLSWTPTLVLLIMFKKLIPNKTRKNYIKESFSQKINIKIIITTAIAFIFSILLTYLLMLNNNDVLSLKSGNLSFVFIISEILVCILSGATGEELGWRGYLQNHFEEKNNGNVIKSALKVGLIWSFWHIPLWFVSASGTVIFLLNYIATFIITNICLSIVIAICYKHCRNLFIPMWIHFLANITLSLATPFFISESVIIIAKWILSLFYIVMTTLFIVWYKTKYKLKQ
jgi:membrane protease YdiL (CAAX protease family)